MRIFWKASSTLLASRAEVSIKERLFSPAGWSAYYRCLRVASRTGKLLRLLGRHSPQMSQIALVSHEHDDDVCVGMVPQLLQPPGHGLVCLVFADIVDEEGANGTAIVGRGDGTIPFLPSCVPDLRLDRLCINLDAPGRKLDTDGRLGVEVELVAGESAQQVGFTDSRVSDEHDWRKERLVEEARGQRGGGVFMATHP